MSPENLITGCRRARVVEVLKPVSPLFQQLLQDRHALLEHFDIDDAKARQVRVALDVLRVSKNLPGRVDLAKLFDDVPS